MDNGKENGSVYLRFRDTPTINPGVILLPRRKEE